MKKLWNAAMDYSFHTSYFVSKDNKIIYVILLTTVIILKIRKDDRWMENGSTKVGDDCPVTVVATRPNTGLDMNESLCAEDEEDVYFLNQFLLESS